MFVVMHCSNGATPRLLLGSFGRKLVKEKADPSSHTLPAKVLLASAFSRFRPSQRCPLTDELRTLEVMKLAVLNDCTTARVPPTLRQKFLAASQLSL